jgi:glycosyltransferase involved in cell wall biosynthesis
MKGSLFAPYKTFLTNSIRHAKSQGKILMAPSKYVAKTVEILTGLTVDVLYPPFSSFFKIGNKLPSKSNTVVTVTRISSDKRPQSILEIAKLVPDDISFVIVGSFRNRGDGSILNSLQEQIHRSGVSEKVKLHLNVSREKQREILQKSKVYLHPFVPYESFGVSAVEAMSAGCIPIAPDIAGLKEIVPKHLRYTSVEEAASLVEESIANWSPGKAQDSIAITDSFSQANFQKEFLRIMRLNA